MSLIKRTEVCPTLIRTFIQKDEHHSFVDFSKEFPSPEVYVYSWPDATLRELAYTIVRSAKLSDVKSLTFEMISPNNNEGGWALKKIGEVDLTETEPGESHTIEELGFSPGFMLDVAYAISE